MLLSARPKTLGSVSKYLFNIKNILLHFKSSLFLFKNKCNKKAQINYFWLSICNSWHKNERDINIVTSLRKITKICQTEEMQLNFDEDVETPVREILFSNYRSFSSFSCCFLFQSVAKEMMVARSFDVWWLRIF